MKTKYGIATVALATICLLAAPVLADPRDTAYPTNAKEAA